MDGVNCSGCQGSLFTTLLLKLHFRFGNGILGHGFKDITSLRVYLLQESLMDHTSDISLTDTFRNHAGYVKHN